MSGAKVAKCRFCDGGGSRYVGKDVLGEMAVFCRNCGARSGGEKSKAAAVRNWNRVMESMGRRKEEMP